MSSSKNADREWLRRDTERMERAREAEAEAKKRRLAERDAAYAAMFPKLVKRKQMHSRREIMNDPLADQWRRFA